MTWHVFYKLDRKCAGARVSKSMAAGFTVGDNPIGDGSKSHICPICFFRCQGGGHVDI